MSYQSTIPQVGPMSPPKSEFVRCLNAADEKLGDVLHHWHTSQYMAGAYAAKKLYELLRHLDALERAISQERGSV